MIYIQFVKDSQFKEVLTAEGTYVRTKWISDIFGELIDVSGWEARYIKPATTEDVVSYVNENYTKK